MSHGPPPQLYTAARLRQFQRAERYKALQQFRVFIWQGSGSRGLHQFVQIGSQLLHGHRLPGFLQFVSGGKRIGYPVALNPPPGTKMQQC